MLNLNYYLRHLRLSVRSSSGMTIAWIVALAATILVFIFIIPERRKATMNAFFKFLHKLFNFKFLVIEKVLQFLYIFMTFLAIMMGLIFIFNDGLVSGLLMILLSPIVIRIVFELSMIVIIAIKNIIEINEKLPSKNDTTKAAAAPAGKQTQPTANFSQTNAHTFCAECGSALNPDGSCSNPSCPTKHYRY